MLPLQDFTPDHLRCASSAFSTMPTSVCGFLSTRLLLAALGYVVPSSLDLLDRLSVTF